jgi:hypothetical protein
MQTLRALRRAPWYSVTVIGVIALGMTVATTVFAIVDGVLFRPMPYPDSNRLFAIEPTFSDVASPPRQGTSRADIANWTAVAPDVAFTAFQAQPWSQFGTGVNDDAAGVAQVMPNVFDVLGVRPWIGGFAKEDFEQTTDASRLRPVIITYDLWQSRFQGEPTLVGRAVETDPATHYGFRVVGIMPRGFTFPSDRWEIRFLTPLPADPERKDAFTRRFGEPIARVPAAMSADALRDRVEAGMRATAAVFPARGAKPPGWSDRGWRMQGPFDRAHVKPLSTSLGSQSRPLFRAVFLAVALLVGLSAINVSGLMAARTLDRARELGLRRSLGASAASIGRLVFAEAFALILVGAALGFLFVQPLLHFALSLLPEDIVLFKPPQIDWRVAAFVALGAVALSVPTALWPIRRALRAGAQTTGDGSRASARVRGVGRFAAIAAQVAGALVLTVVGTLLVGSILAVYGNDRPIRTDGVVVIESRMGGPGVGGKSPTRAARVGPILDRLRQVPGVQAVALTSAQVLRGGNWPSWFTPPAGAVNARLDVDVQAVAADYYRVLQPQLLSGRLPSDADLASSARVLVVSEGVARVLAERQRRWTNACRAG